MAGLDIFLTYYGTGNKLYIIIIIIIIIIIKLI